MLPMCRSNYNFKILKNNKYRIQFNMKIIELNVISLQPSRRSLASTIPSFVIYNKVIHLLITITLYVTAIIVKIFFLPNATTYVYKIMICLNSGAES